jgi:hypothetical protein
MKKIALKKAKYFFFVVMGDSLNRLVVADHPFFIL